MKPIASFRVRPCLPASLQPLLRIAHNLRWSWDHAAIDLFRRLDRDLWEKCNRNPVLFLGSIDQPVLEAASNDDSFLAHLHGVTSTLDAYLTGEGSWFRREHDADKDLLTAYFSAEFGITECVSIFAGGLGVLAGDHLKASSDLGLPLIGVGLLYQQGYFRQYLNAAGWQQEAFEDNDFHTWPITLIPDLLIEVPMPDGPLRAQVWSLDVGRIRLFLLDTNIPANSSEQRSVTNQLYGGGLETRMKQEILLGIGGYRALRAMGLDPSVFHMNEGHSAFLALEHIRYLMQSRNLSYLEARLLASASLVFTTHTPVPAGHDYFSPQMVDRYFGEYMRCFGITREEFLALGRQDSSNDAEEFCMTVLALRLASYSNAVSKLHGVVSRRMWNGIWKGLPEDEVPIGHVTNGVHFRSWVSVEMNHLFDRYLGPKWREEPADTKLWRRVQSIPAIELWRTHERRRERLVAYARKLLRQQLISRGAPHTAVDEADEVLSPDALTIGFGRRFATYKRATLLLRDPERLARILNDPKHPVQIIYAGKAHPRDTEGKHLIQTIISLAARPEFRRRLVFLENYDMAVARYMVQGCDVWLNTPLRPLEASGTSGMKAQANGVLNVSTLDGWWDEAWAMGNAAGVEVGWAIGRAEHYDDPADQDRVEAEALYELLERDIVPTFYEHRADGLPRKWIDRMKASMVCLCPEFNMQRMAMQYASEYYLAAHRRHLALRTNDCDQARGLSAWQSRLRAQWSGISVEPANQGFAEIEFGKEVLVSARVALNALTPEDVIVQVVFGRISAAGDLHEPQVVPMELVGEHGTGAYLYRATLQPRIKSGLHGYTFRVLPGKPEHLSQFIPGLVTWAEQASAFRELQPA
ncbi:MAG TPA: alpha-glucan family phosphorylase [Candidatus Acidoferrales bacterium]|nr:alpha-glucan family phosphorylase [Candidatus Acidoferrales bacterium]